MRPELILEDIYNLMRFGSIISNISEAAGISTITTDNIFTLKNDMLVEVGNRVYPVSSITRTGVSEWTFEITATGLTATGWKLGLYYEYGRALEINATLKDQKDDPINKNKRFPLMWLLTDIEKDENFEIGYEAPITIAFIYLSEQNIKAEKRIETKMLPILDPLVELFKDTITTSPGSRNFIYPFGTQLDLSETDKFKYGSVANNTHVFDDITDAIQLDMTLRFNVETGNCNY
jgi:hypothetical protein